MWNTYSNTISSHNVKWITHQNIQILLVNWDKDSPQKCIRPDSRFVSSQWETALLCNDLSLVGCKPRKSPEHLYFHNILEWLERDQTSNAQKTPYILQSQAVSYQNPNIHVHFLHTPVQIFFSWNPSISVILSSNCFFSCYISSYELSWKTPVIPDCHDLLSWVQVASEEFLSNSGGIWLLKEMKTVCLYMVLPWTRPAF